MLKKVLAVVVLIVVVLWVLNHPSEAGALIHKARQAASTLADSL